MIKCNSENKNSPYQPEKILNAEKILRNFLPHFDFFLSETQEKNYDTVMPTETQASR
jgi:hypothetical protein